MIPLDPWIQAETVGYRSVIDLGCRFGNRLHIVWIGVARRKGIEICKQYLDRGRQLGFIDGAIVQADHGDMRVADCRGYEVAMLIDTLEHIEKQDGLDLIQRLKGEVLKILVFTPNGFNEQTASAYEPEADEYEVHRSGWTIPELEALGFSCKLDPEHHPHYPPGAIFATWVKPS